MKYQRKHIEIENRKLIELDRYIRMTDKMKRKSIFVVVVFYMNIKWSKMFTEH